MDTTTTHNLGQLPGGVRRGAVASVVCTSWRRRCAASTCDAGIATRGYVHPMRAYLATTNPADATNVSFAKRPARHLARGST